MNAFAVLTPVFQWMVDISPIVAVVVILILAIRKWLGSKLDPKVFYAVWIILIVRTLIPWFPSGGFRMWEIVLGPSFNRDTIDVYGNLNMAEGEEAFRHKTIIDPAMHSETDWLAAGGSSTAYVIWLSGLLMILTYFGFTSWKWRRQINAEATGISDTQFHTWFSECKAKLGIKKHVPVLSTSLVNTPATFGLWKPIILIPKHIFGKLDRKEWECILIHELIHIRRKDYLWNGFMILVSALQWFNPLIWIAFFKMREDQEAYCDAKTMNHVNKVQYGKTLIKMLELASMMNRKAILPFISGKNKRIQRRVEMILSKKQKVLTFAVVIMIALVAVLVITNPGLNAKAKTGTNQFVFLLPAEGEARINDKGELNIRNSEGTPVYATESGTIEHAGYTGTDGNHIRMAHGNKYESIYKHLQEIHVAVGQTVEKGQQIGTIGSTGRSTGPHLSFSLLENGQLVNVKDQFDIKN